MRNTGKGIYRQVRMMSKEGKCNAHGKKFRRHPRRSAIALMDQMEEGMYARS
jgi:hypothetical protein